MKDKEYLDSLILQFGAGARRIEKAIDFATKKHEGQLRDDGRPYITHPIRVAELTRMYKPSHNAEMIYIAALLHDTLEDTYTSYKELMDNFGNEVASLVMELSTAKEVPHIIKGGKAEYLSHKMENMTTYALFIKLCDRYDNLCDVAGTTEEKRNKMFADTRKILDYLYDHITFTSSQKTIVNMIEKELKKHCN
ncbi:MAG: bifunctional (p)ppGpp synthetase/guanosine-3',5'-bis(diphosphate) 3'-pyrophosphohydrolase [Clostridia bacterium]|nr:bifunctional (p)ppGpp synthetase/guanosine-3',5'-bis(diphosphate) 3'-pyrophosphohydrolase [Clostridia bacterium]